MNPGRFAFSIRVSNLTWRNQTLSKPYVSPVSSDVFINVSPFLCISVFFYFYPLFLDTSVCVSCILSCLYHWVYLFIPFYSCIRVLQHLVSQHPCSSVFPVSLYLCISCILVALYFLIFVSLHFMHPCIALYFLYPCSSVFPYLCVPVFLVSL